MNFKVIAPMTREHIFLGTRFDKRNWATGPVILKFPRPIPHEIAYRERNRRTLVWNGDGWREHPNGPLPWVRL